MPVLPENHSLKTYQVSLGGQALKLKSNQDPHTFNSIVEVVRHHLKQSAEGKNQNLPLQKALILSCLNMAEELVCLKKNLFQQMKQMELFAQKLYGKVKSSSYPLSR